MADVSIQELKSDSTTPYLIVSAHPDFEKHGNKLTATKIPTAPGEPTYGTLSLTSYVTSATSGTEWVVVPGKIGKQIQNKSFKGSLGIAKDAILIGGTAVVQVEKSKDTIVEFHLTPIALEKTAKSVYVISPVDGDVVDKASLWLTANPTTGAVTLETRRDGLSQYWTFT